MNQTVSPRKQKTPSSQRGCYQKCVELLKEFPPFSSGRPTKGNVFSAKPLRVGRLKSSNYVVVRSGAAVSAATTTFGSRGNRLRPRCRGASPSQEPRDHGGDMGGNHKPVAAGGRLSSTDGITSHFKIAMLSDFPVVSQPKGMFFPPSRFGLDD